jgi:large subunit ribosomal protein L22
MRNARISPRKVRLVANAVKGKSFGEAVALLRFMPQRAAGFVAKTVKSAAANAENNLDIDPRDLFLVEVTADKGLAMQRFRAKARGRAGPYRRQWSHITVIVEERRS